ncbi:tetratricopeptide repeat protein [Rhodococcus wratislaviensis]|uniref:Orc1-like AAA ATPase domain-containing protein n=1 Tax=Rhodococcus wratislaviensis NBRC 100605 TaxID=1219028 RepID=X0RDN8_RHOWR|nr:tetratricopeptide repeat protein [Rhodococcus wratislaviensis]GAF49155.1 hypothetical protein RW1_069_00230 [Rhodococcus wratislaviensis NBRC 100605]
MISVHAANGGIAAGSIGTLNYFAAQKGRVAAAVRPIVPEPHAPALAGRERELGDLTDLLTETGSGGTSVVAIAGAPGIGKSELARSAALRGIATGQTTRGLFVNMQGYDPDPENQVAPEDVYSSLLRALGFPGDDIPATNAEQATVYHQYMDELAHTDESVLLVIDNASTVAQFAPLIPSGLSHRVIVTSRDTFGGVPGMRTLELDVLSADASVLLMTNATTQRDRHDNRLRDDPTSAHELARLCGRLPLALQIVAALIADEPARPLTDLVDELADENTRLSGFDYDVNWSVRAAISLSYRRLPEDLSKLFRLLPLIPGGDVGLRAAAALSGEKEPEVRRKLMRLVRAHLADKQAEERWRMHDLIRIYAAELSRDPDSDAAFQRMILRYMVDFMAAGSWILYGKSDPRLSDPFPSRTAAVSWFGIERPTLVAAVRELSRRPEFHRMAVEFGLPLCTALDKLRYLDDQVTVATLWASTAAHVGDEEAEVLALNHLGGALRRVRRFDEAIDMHERALASYRRRGDRRGEGVAKTNLANVLQDLGRFDEAIQLYQEDLARCEESGDATSAGETLTNLAGVLIKAGQPDEAIAALRQPLELFRRLGNREGYARTTDLIGGALQRKGDMHAAASAHREAATIYLELDNQYARSGAMNNLALALMSLGDAQSAAAIYSEQLEVLEQLDDRHRRGIALNNLGMALTRLGRIVDAIDAHREAAEIFVHYKDVGNEATARLLLGAALRNNRQIDEARTTLHQALSMFETAGSREDADEARQLLKGLE